MQTPGIPRKLSLTYELSLWPKCLVYFKSRFSLCYCKAVRSTSPQNLSLRTVLILFSSVAGFPNTAGHTFHTNRWALWVPPTWSSLMLSRTFFSMHQSWFLITIFLYLCSYPQPVFLYRKRYEKKAETSAGHKLRVRTRTTVHSASSVRGCCNWIMNSMCAF